MGLSVLAGCGGSAPKADTATEAAASDSAYVFLDETLGVESYAIGLRVGEEELANTVSGAVQALVLNGKYDEIRAKYPDIADYLCLKAEDIDEAYIKKVLPEKMRLQLEEIKNFSLLHDLKTLFKTVL